jgi:outer membrane protein OmpA-like peptidoglycan-associated protein
MRNLLIVLAFALGVNVHAQTSEKASQRIGLFGNVDAALNMASFTGLPSVASCCPEYSNVTDLGWLVGLTYIRPLTEPWTLHVRAHYGSYSGTFSSLETQPVIGAGGTEEMATVRHDLATSFDQISIEPLAGYAVTKDLSLLGGLTMGYLLSSTYEQKETLEDPQGATFENLLRERNAFSGPIPTAASVAFGITIGASYDLALNSDRTVFLSPEVLFSFSPISHVSGISYNVHHLRAGLALSFVPPALQDSLYGSELYEYSRGLTVPTSTSAAIPFIARVTAKGMTADGSTAGVNELHIEEFTSRRIRPLLPYVFFDASSYELPTRYHEIESSQRATFSMENFYNLDALVTYRHLLNIIGKRMTDRPTSSIAVVGHATPEERGGDDLALARAKTVKDYLTSVWGVDPGRITTRAKGLPSAASRMETADGKAENQRVEIESEDPDLLAPVTSIDTLRRSTPEVIRFEPSIDPKVPVRSWTLFVSADGSLRKYFHDGNPVPSSVLWRPTAETGVLLPRTREVGYLLAVTDTNGTVIPSETRFIPVRTTRLADKQGNDRQIDRYSLILFGFDSDELTSAHRRMISEFGATIKSNSVVSITGHTDRAGDEAYNRTLSERRAKAVARQLGVPESSVWGMGETALLYDNSTPEGRFYCRTVEVIVETPKN